MVLTGCFWQQFVQNLLKPGRNRTSALKLVVLPKFVRERRIGRLLSGFRRVCFVHRPTKIFHCLSRQRTKPQTAHVKRRIGSAAFPAGHGFLRIFSAIESAPTADSVPSIPSNRKTSRSRSPSAAARNSRSAINERGIRFRWPSVGSAQMSSSTLCSKAIVSGSNECPAISIGVDCTMTENVAPNALWVCTTSYIRRRNRL